MKTIITKILFLFSVLLMATPLFAKDNLMAPPVNDLIENAIDLNNGPLPYTIANVNFPEATSTGDGASTGCGQFTAGIWYKFYATDGGNVSAFIQTNSSAIVTFYTANDSNATNANQLTYVNQPSNPCAFSNLSEIDTQTDTYYYIFMRNLVASTVAINVSNAFHSLDNDQITSATEVDINNPITLFSDIHFLVATNDNDGGQDGCDSDLIAGIWYLITTALDEMTLQATISSDPNASALIFYTEENGGALSGSDLTFVNQPGNVCGSQDNATILAEPNKRYFLFVATAEPYADVTIETTVVLGVTENQLEGFDYYPNPITNEINISAKTTIDEVSIYNLLGQNVYQQKIDATKKSIEFSHLQTGMYVMRVTAEGSTATYKIVKE